MRLSTKCRYGLRAMIDLALFSGRSHVALRDIADRQEISLKYLEQDFSILKRSGLIRSVKGAQGGYLLARPASEIRVGEIIEILEGDLYLIDPPTGEEPPIRAFLYTNLWNDLNHDVADIFHSVTLAELAEEYAMTVSGGSMYYI